MRHFLHQRRCRVSHHCSTLHLRRPSQFQQAIVFAYGNICFEFFQELDGTTSLTVLSDDNLGLFSQQLDQKNKLSSLLALPSVHSWFM